MKRSSSLSLLFLPNRYPISGPLQPLLLGYVPRNRILVRIEARAGTCTPSTLACTSATIHTTSSATAGSARTLRYINPPCAPPRPRGFNPPGTFTGHNPRTCITTPHHRIKKQEFYREHHRKGGEGEKRSNRSKRQEEEKRRQRRRITIVNRGYLLCPTLFALGVFTFIESSGFQNSGPLPVDLPERAESGLNSASYPPICLGFTNTLESNQTSVGTCLIGQEDDQGLIKASTVATSPLQVFLLKVATALLRFWPFRSPEHQAHEDDAQATTDNSPDEEKFASKDSNSDSTDSTMTTPKILPGRPETLTAEQEAKLKELWGATLKLFNRLSAEAEVDDEPDNDADDVDAGTPGRVDSDLSLDKKKKKKFGLRRNKKNKGGDDASVASSSGTSTPHSGILSSSTEADDKYGLTKEFRHTISTMTTEELRNAFLTFGKFDHPDALLLRFLRARKWDVEKALVMMVSTIKWRAREVNVEEIVGEGELDALKSGDEGFMKQLRMGKSFIHGVDREGRPICVIRVHLHRGSDQPPEAIEKYTVYLIETARIMLTPPVDTACVLFDMSKFGLANMDYTPVKFMIKCFEAHYPESLGICLIHKAPWIFQSIWSIIKGWLDPVVASKIHFTKSLDDLEKFIPKSQIIQELEGDEKWEYEYIEPSENENAAHLDTAARDKLQEEREELYDRFEENTKAWMKEPNTGSDSGTPLKEERKELVRLLRENYWKLDKHIRAKTWYDRTGVIKEGGKVEFYGKTPNGAAPAGMNIDID